MIGISAQWNPMQSRLKSIIMSKDRFDEAVSLCHKMHSLVHSSEMSGSDIPTYEDELWNGLSLVAFNTMPTIIDNTIAWNIWHITRIEDITANILIANGNQVLNNDWLQKMNVNLLDTGNAMSDSEILDLGAKINIDSLKAYRIAVGRKTRTIIDGLKPEDMRRKMEPSSLARILSEGAVLDKPESRWLIDFWGRKNVAGILLMPITRHQIVHLNEAFRLKAKCERIQLIR